ncbi:MAG: ABC transporter ATP-binding protein [Acidobacteriota bacterium]
MTDRSTDVLVDVQDLTKHYGEIRAVDGISFSVRRGDVLAFLGPNGAGKTTAMKMITGFLEPDSGSVSIAGQRVTPDETSVRRRIGYLPENAPAYGEMTVRDFLSFIARVRELSEPKGAVDRSLATTFLENVQHQVIETLSKGFKRRVGLAQALLHDPDVLILDEPTDGLDPNQKAVVQELISSLSEDKSIVVSTHILDEAERFCDRVVVLADGRILVDSTPSELVRQAPDHNVVHLRFRGEAPDGLIARLIEQPWCENAASLADGSLEVRPRDGENRLQDVLELADGAAIETIRLHEGRLDDLFRKITGGRAA